MPVDRMIHPRLGDSEKVAKLTDLEFRVWITYLLAADDFGVLPLGASKLQGADRTLSNRRALQVTRALESAVAIDLIQAFEHQGAIYVWSATWQHHQRIRYPRREQTHYPCPPEPTLRMLSAPFTAPTRDLFATFHMGVSPAFRDEFGDKDTLAAIAERESKRAQKKPRRSGDVAGMEPKRSGDVATLTRAGAPETAHGLRPTAEVSSEEEGAAFRADVALRQLQAAYPKNRVTYGYRTESAFIDALGPVTPEATFVLMMANLENHRDSHEWRIKGMVPALEKWLRDGLWQRQMDAHAPAAEQVTAKTGRTLAAAAEVLNRRQA